MYCTSQYSFEKFIIQIDGFLGISVRVKRKLRQGDSERWEMKKLCKSDSN